MPRDESHLILRSTLRGLVDLGHAVPGLRLRCHGTIPHGRGLGSSSAAIVAGLLAASGLVHGVREETAASRRWTLQHAAAIEGHPDNVAAAVHGGFVLAWTGPEGVEVAVRAWDGPGLDATSPLAEPPLTTRQLVDLAADDLWRR